MQYVIRLVDGAVTKFVEKYSESDGMPSTTKVKNKARKFDSTDEANTFAERYLPAYQCVVLRLVNVSEMLTALRDFFDGTIGDADEVVRITGLSQEDAKEVFEAIQALRDLTPADIAKIK